MPTGRLSFVEALPGGFPRVAEIVLAANAVNHQSSEASATTLFQLQAKRTWNLQLRHRRFGTSPCSVSERLRNENVFRELREAHDRTTARWPAAPWMLARAFAKRIKHCQVDFHESQKSCSLLEMGPIPFLVSERLRIASDARRVSTLKRKGRRGSLRPRQIDRAPCETRTVTAVCTWMGCWLRCWQRFFRLSWEAGALLPYK